MSQSKDNHVPGLPDANPDRAGRRNRMIIWLAVAIIASLVSFFLSWPWWRDFSYWAESRIMWKIYFALGFLLAIYVFYAFFGCLRTLFEHDEIERAEIAAQEGAAEGEDQP